MAISGDCYEYIYFSSFLYLQPIKYRSYKFIRYLHTIECNSLISIRSILTYYSTNYIHFYSFNTYMLSNKIHWFQFIQYLLSIKFTIKLIYSSILTPYQNNIPSNSLYTYNLSNIITPIHQYLHPIKHNYTHFTIHSLLTHYQIY